MADGAVPFLESFKVAHFDLHSFGIGDSMILMVDESLAFVKGFKYIIPLVMHATAERRFEGNQETGF